MIVTTTGNREIPVGATICEHGIEPFTCRVCFPPIRTADFGVKDIREIPAAKPGQGAKI
jgi:hypothetical protein